jgi:hypothetical protein
LPSHQEIPVVAPIEEVTKSVVASSENAAIAEPVITGENTTSQIKTRKSTAWTKHRRRVARKHPGLPWRAKLIRAQITYKPAVPRSFKRVFRYAYDYLHSPASASTPPTDKELSSVFVDVMLDYINAGEASPDFNMKLNATPDESADDSEPDTAILAEASS